MIARAALSARLENYLRHGAHVWLFALIFSTFIAEASALVLIILWLWLRQLRRTPLDYFILLFLGVRLLTIATALAPAMSVHALRKLPFILVYFPLAHVTHRFGASESFKLLRTLISADLAASLLGLLRTQITPVWRLASTTSGATTLAMFLAVTFVITLALVLRKELRLTYAWLLAAATMLLALAFTRCRAPWLAALSVGVFLVKPVRRNVMLLALIALIILLLVPGFGMRHAEVLHWPPHLGDRPIIWKTGWERVIQRPLLGHGPESFTLLFHAREELQDKRAGSWHDFALQLLVESGALGLVAFLTLMLQAFRLMQNRFKEKLSLFDERTAAALRAALATLLLAGLFGGLIGDPLMDMLLWGMLGMVSGFATEVASTA